MDIEIKNQILKVIQQIKAWDPEEYNAEMLLRLCDPGFGRLTIRDIYFYNFPP